MGTRMSSQESPRAYTCKKCGWSGMIVGRTRCTPCSRYSSKKWRMANPSYVRPRPHDYREKISAIKKRYRSTFTEERRIAESLKRKAWRQANKDRVRRLWKIRCEWLNSGDVTKEQLTELYESSGRCCHYCKSFVRALIGATRATGFDHVISRAAGGRHTISNMVVCCKSCNEKKAGQDRVQARNQSRNHSA